MYQVEKLSDGELYTFKEINLKIKAIAEDENVCIYIYYKRYNPLFSIPDQYFKAKGWL